MIPTDQYRCTAGCGTKYQNGYFGRETWALLEGDVLPDTTRLSADSCDLRTGNQHQTTNSPIQSDAAISIDMINSSGNAASRLESSRNKKNLDINDRVCIHKRCFVCSTLAVAWRFHPLLQSSFWIPPIGLPAQFAIRTAHLLEARI